jgi:hypothetical protein
MHCSHVFLISESENFVTAVSVASDSSKLITDSRNRYVIPVCVTREVHGRLPQKKRNISQKFCPYCITYLWKILLKMQLKMSYKLSVAYLPLPSLLFALDVKVLICTYKG